MLLVQLNITVDKEQLSWMAHSKLSIALYCLHKNAPTEWNDLPTLEKWMYFFNYESFGKRIFSQCHNYFKYHMFHHNKLITTANCFNDKKKRQMTYFVNLLLRYSFSWINILIEHYLKLHTLMQQFIAFNDFYSDGRLLSFVFKHCIHEASATWLCKCSWEPETALPCKCIISLISVYVDTSFRDFSLYRSLNLVSQKSMNIDWNCVSDFFFFFFKFFCLL